MIEDLLVATYIQRLEQLLGPQVWLDSGLANGSKYCHINCQERRAKKLKEAVLGAGLRLWVDCANHYHVMCYVRIGYNWYYTPEGW